VIGGTSARFTSSNKQLICDLPFPSRQAMVTLNSVQFFQPIHPSDVLIDNVMHYFINLEVVLPR
jgi:hypothetical protein